MGIQANAQREAQLLAEWLTSLPKGWKSKTHVNVGRVALQYNGSPLTPAMQNAFGNWNSWSDARVFTGAEVWIVEAKIVATGCAYGEVLDYCNQYKGSSDYEQFLGAPIKPVVLCAYARDPSRIYFAQFGVTTIIFTPSWASVSLSTKVFNATGT